MGDQDRDQARVFAAALRELYERAGSPAYSVLVRQGAAQRPPVKLSDASISDWLNGRSTPSNPKAVKFLVEYLQGKASAGYRPPPLGWWEETRREAQSQRRPGRGGRPARRNDGPGPAAASEPGLLDLHCTLRSRNRFFTGRERDLAALAAKPQGRTVLSQSLVGLGGIGKSALALEYAHRRYAAGEVDLAWWFAAEERSMLLASMAGLYDRITGMQSGGEDTEAGAIALRNWLEHRPYRWIVVFDNAELGALEGILPRNGTGQVVITSRASDWRDIDATHIVSRLPLGQAADLLVKITELPADDGARQITEELGGLALAIEQAAAYIRQTCTGYRDYLEALRSDPRAVYDADLAQMESVAARVWRRSLHHVTGGQADHPAAVMLGVMAYMAPEDIPRQLFSPAAVQAVPMLGNLGMVKLTKALGELKGYSLIVLDRDSISIHRVIQHITRLDACMRGRERAYAAGAIGLLNACL